MREVNAITLCLGSDLTAAHLRIRELEQTRDSLIDLTRYYQDELTRLLEQMGKMRAEKYGR